MTLDDAFQLLEKYYRFAMSNENIQNKTAWALYKAWEIADKSKAGKPEDLLFHPTDCGWAEHIDD